MELLVLLDLLAWFPGIAVGRFGPEYLLQFSGAPRFVYACGASACLLLAMLRTLRRVLPLSGISARKFLATTGLAALATAGVMGAHIGWDGALCSTDLGLVLGVALVLLVVAWRALVYGFHLVTAAVSEGTGVPPG